jgi:formate dehydrogenase (quinone-dependent) catalytic subunit
MYGTKLNLGRRQFLKILGAGAASVTATAMGLSTAEAQVAAAVRPYKLLRSKETRNNCTYCSVGCGILMYSMGDGARNAKPRIFHIEGDPDHPVSRGSLCPKGPAARHDPFEEPAALSRIPGAGLQ